MLSMKKLLQLPDKHYNYDEKESFETLELETPNCFSSP